MAYKRTLTQKVKDKALEPGYVRVGIASVDGFPEYTAELKAALEWAENDVRTNVEWALERLERLIPI